MAEWLYNVMLPLCIVQIIALTWRGSCWYPKHYLFRVTIKRCPPCSQTKVPIMRWHQVPNLLHFGMLFITVWTGMSSQKAQEHTLCSIFILIPLNIFGLDIVSVYLTFNGILSVLSPRRSANMDHTKEQSVLNFIQKWRSIFEVFIVDL